MRKLRFREPRLLSCFVLLFWGCPQALEMAPQGMVSSASPEATQAGLEMLSEGGNAMDAAVAVSLALGVTETANSGLGGQTVMLVYRPGLPAEVVEASSVAPKATPVDATPGDLTGHRLTTVPTTVKTLDYALREFGSGRITWAQALKPATRYAEEGYPLEGVRHRSLAASPAAAAALLEDGGLPDAGELFRQPVLAGTLRRLAEFGASDFYTGEIARVIDRDMEQNGGWLSAADLADAPQPRRVPAITTTYRGHDVFTAPPPYGGWVVLSALKALEQAPADDLAQPGSVRALWLAEALRYAHGMRMRDPVPDFDDWEAAVAARTDPARAAAYMARPTFAGALDRGETTHFSVLDGSGMAVAVTQSLNLGYGARVASPELGFLYNSYMVEFEIGDPDHPFGLRAGARPLSSMSPTVVARDGLELVLGSPGSARIISAVVQVVSNVLDRGMPIEDAVGDARMHVIPAETGTDILYLEGLDPVFDAETDETGITRATGPADYDPGLPVGPTEAVAHWGGQQMLQAASAAGFAVNGRPSGDAAATPIRLSSYFGGVHAIAVREGAVTGAADPRRDGVAAAIGDER